MSTALESEAVQLQQPPAPSSACLLLHKFALTRVNLVLVDFRARYAYTHEVLQVL